MSLTLLLMTLCSVAVQGVLLPGKCPSVPPTNFSWIRHSHIEHRLSLRFSSQKSHIFNSSMSLTGITYYEREGVYRFKSRSIELNAHVEGNITRYANGSTWMTSDIIIDSVHCQDTITEEVRVWLDKSTLILWSCVDGHGTEHDEAALVFEYYEKMHGKFSMPDILEAMKTMNVSARKYLSDTFLDMIDWSRDPRKSSIRPHLHVPDECLAKESAQKALKKSRKTIAKKPEITSRNNPSLYLVGIYPIVLLALVCTVLWFNRDVPEEESLESNDNQEWVVRKAWE